jgi:hypothetical protein
VEEYGTLWKRLEESVEYKATGGKYFSEKLLADWQNTMGILRP